MIKRFLFLLLITAGVISANAQYSFIDEVLEYTPAPGQFINTPPWGMPGSAQSIVGTISGSLTLGAWGGYVIFRFKEAVQNHPDNPFGIDFIIFGNPTTTWPEPATVWVMKDENKNGLPDGTWYQLAGSDYFFSTTLHNYEVTYFNPHSENASDISWEDSEGNKGTLPANSSHNQNYYPDHALFPHIAPDQYTLRGSRMKGNIDKSNPAFITSAPRAFGYADNTPRRTAPFNVPDNPYTPGIENAGGDGFDISWAVDEEGNYIDLDEIHFIKVQTAMLDHGGWLGEVSAEITGAVVVEPDPSLTGELKMVVLKDLPKVIDQSPYPLEVFVFDKGRFMPDKKVEWTIDHESAYIDDEGWLHFDSSGELSLTALLQDHPDVFTTATTLLQFTPTHIENQAASSVSIYPNPTTNHIRIKTESETEFILYNLHGKEIMKVSLSQGVHSIDIQHIKPGIYLVTTVQSGGIAQKKVVIQ